MVKERAETRRSAARRALSLAVVLPGSSNSERGAVRLWLKREEGVAVSSTVSAAVASSITSALNPLRIPIAFQCSSVCSALPSLTSLQPPSTLPQPLPRRQHLAGATALGCGGRERQWCVRKGTDTQPVPKDTCQGSREAPSVSFERPAKDRAAAALLVRGRRSERCILHRNK